jgi:RNA polymerase sigma-70 factor (ECF subfamily)
MNTTSWDETDGSHEDFNREGFDPTPDSATTSTPSSSSSAAAAPPPEWPELVARIRSGDDQAMERLYSTFARGIRYYLCRHLGSQELEDKVHDTFLIVVQAIRGGTLREPERLMGFVRTVVRRQVAAFIDQAVHRRREFADLELGTRIPDSSRDPEAQSIDREKAQFMLKILQGISNRDREILTRFYLYEQTQEQICREMQLTETQFRLLKSRAKARFAELGRQRLTGAALNTQIVRKATGAGH